MTWLWLGVVNLAAAAAAPATKWKVAVPDSLNTCNMGNRDPGCEQGSYCECSIPSVALNEDLGLVFFGTTFSGIYALNATTGAQIWHAPSNQHPSAADILVDDGNLILATAQNLSTVTPAHVTSLDAHTGAVVWSRWFNATSYSAYLALGSGLIYVPVYGFAFDIGHLYALNASTGDIAWEYTARRKYGLFKSLVAVTTSTNEEVLVAAGDFEVAALDAHGKTKWIKSFTNESVVDASSSLRFALGPDTLFGGFSSHAFSLDVLSGEFKWSADVGNFRMIVAAAKMETTALILSKPTQMTASPDAQLNCFDAATGKLYWVSSLSMCGIATYAGMQVSPDDNTTVYVLCSKVPDQKTASTVGYLVAINAASGSQLWNITEGLGTIRSAQTLVRSKSNTLYYGTSNSPPALMTPVPASFVAIDVGPSQNDAEADENHPLA